MKVKAIDFVVSNVSDIDRAQAFYRDTLGISDPVNSESDGWIEFDTNPVALAIAVPPPGWKQPIGGTAIALAVDDVRAAIEELREKGVAILMEPVDTPVCTMAFIADPDGNAIFLHKRHDGTAG